MESVESSSFLRLLRLFDKRADLDQVGMTASLICAVHCAVMPLVIMLLPLVGLGFLAHDSTEWILVGLSLLLGGGSLWLGFREHGRRRALIFLAVGLALLATGRIAESRENEQIGMILAVLGALTVTGAHFVNRRLCLACRVCHPPSEAAMGSAESSREIKF